ncbi:RIP metalloprotease RseP [Candidatus Parcubacteria bacterium]|nr:RIP metalloprotease RseP [Candidatus Parcubacteria bacterium]
MSVLIFIIILGVLIFVHELGHFSVAKKFGIRVDEFAVGFPPKLWSWTKNGTKYALNAIPIGGYVKIFGETADDEALNPENKDSFLNKSRWIQAAVLVAGVAFNIIFAWILFSISLMAGFPTVVTDENRANIQESFVVVTNVRENSPAYEVGLKSGDQIVGISRDEEVLGLDDITVNSIKEFISVDTTTLQLEVVRGGDTLDLSVDPEVGAIDDNNPAIGIAMARIGELQFGFFESFWQGFLMTGTVIKEIGVGFYGLLSEVFSGNGSLDNVAGPVGIVNLVDSASNFGFVYLLGFTAFISINLAILNIFPFPALDGGRLIIVLIEGVTRRRIKPSVVNAINAIGFILLLLLMLIITVNDVVNLF